MIKRRVLIISTSFPRWKNDQVTSFIFHFAKSIKEQYDVHVLAPHAEGAKTYEDMDGVKVHRFLYAPKKLEKFGTGVSIMDTIKGNSFTLLLIPFFVSFGALKMTRLHLKYKYDVIHVNWLVPFGPVVGFLRLFFKFRYVITSHGSDVFPFANKVNALSRFVWWAHRTFSLPNADKVVTVSNALKSALMRMLPDTPQEKVSIISMGIDYDLFKNQRQRQVLQPPLKIVFVGRLTEIKGVRYLIDAMNILKKQNINFELQIYGDGSSRESLESQVNELTLSDHVFFNGFVGHDVLPKKLAESDIFVGPSITTSRGETEGLGLVFLEAMAAGLVVVGSNVGGISDIIKNKETGVLVDEKNPAAIAEAILLLEKDDELRSHIINNGKKLAQQYDWAIIAGKYYQVFENKDQ